MTEQEGHVSVLLEEAIDALSIEPSDVVVDATVGGAGHFGRLLGMLGAEGILLGIDADGDAIARAEAVLAAKQSLTPSDALPRVELAHDNFRNLADILDEKSLTPTKVLFDLGWSSYHLGSGRGFSFRSEEPLLMTYGEPEEGKTAADLVNTLPEAQLADLIYTYGEERFARAIARSIVRERANERILTTTQLVEAIIAGTPAWYHHRRLHPATKTFQALRIAVNEELDALREGLGAAIDRVSNGGRIAVITFHSIEDRVVKCMLRDAAHEGKGMLVTRKPVIPSEHELEQNPRARSAKLRVFEVGECPEAANYSTNNHLQYA